MSRIPAILCTALALLGCATTHQQTDYSRLKTTDRFSPDLISAGSLGTHTIAVIPASVVIKNPQDGTRWSTDEARVYPGDYPVQQKLFYRDPSTGKTAETDLSAPNVQSYYAKAGKLQEVMMRDTVNPPKPVAVTYNNLSTQCRAALAEVFTQGSSKVYDGQWEEVPYTQAVLKNPQFNATPAFTECTRTLPRYIALAGFEGQQLQSADHRAQLSQEREAKGKSGRFFSDMADMYTDPATWLVGYEGYKQKQGVEQANNALGGEATVLLLDRHTGKIAAYTKRSISYSSFENIPQTWMQSVTSVNAGLATLQKARTQPALPR